MHRPSILSVGTDHELLAARAHVLRHGGYDVVVAVTNGEVAQVLEGRKFDLILLCHSIPTSRLSRLILLVRRTQPTTPVLLLEAHYRRGISNCYVFDSFEGPEALLRRIEQLLAGRDRALGQAC